MTTIPAFHFWAASPIPSPWRDPALRSFALRSPACPRALSAVGTSRSNPRRRPGCTTSYLGRAASVKVMGLLGTMQSDVVKDGTLHVRTPLIVSKPMR